MIHYVYATRGGYLYLVGRHNNQPKINKEEEFVVSVPEKTSQAQIDSMAHHHFVENLRRPKRVSADRHQHKAAVSV
tara:strand:- start:49 stop:276 length:228 start_codon:yes stop_codon:yes gene_type:complete